MLEAAGVTKAYPIGKGRNLWALDGVDIAVAPGKTLAVVGESGCGKSTLAKILLRLERPTAGMVRFRGTDLWEMGRDEVAGFRRAVQMIFQDPYGSLNPRMRVGEIVGEPFDVHRLARGEEKRRKVAALLERVGLDDAAAVRYPREFSGGQRQRIGIARALAVEPSLLVADEPVSALDVSIQAQVLNLLRDLQRERGLGLLFISHDLRVVRAISDHTAVMYLGKIVEAGPTEEIFLEPLHPYTRLLLDSVPVADPALRHKGRVGKGEPPSPVDRPTGCPFHPRCPSASSACSATEPPVRTRHEGHQVRCHLLP
jgi:oligopeptide/dipeptide ABC transporter ATP-binding protein